MDLDLANLQEWIGRTEETEDIVTPRLVREFHATFESNLAPVGQNQAPLALHWCLAPPIAPLSELGPDGHPARGGFLPPVPLPNRMWAGGTIETRGPLNTGDTVARRSTIESVSLKEGRSGRLCFVAVRHEISTERGVAIVERHDIVYRDASGAWTSPPARPSSPRSAELSWTVNASPVLLFRYSAMTFNGYRIHYDDPYVREAGGYPGLVVHGPIQATLLLNIVASLAGRVPTSFVYRGVSPLIAGRPFKVAAARAGDGRILAWTENADGVVCMEAEGAN